MDHTPIGRTQSDERVHHIKKAIASGKTREQVARELGYANYRSLDMFMRRRQYYWYPSRKNYFASKKIKKEITPDNRIEAVLRLFEQKVDARAIASQLQFKDHREMSQFMRSKGYTWDLDQSVYVYTGKSKSIETDEEHSDSSLVERYLPLLKKLEENWPQIVKILINNPASKKRSPY